MKTRIICLLLVLLMCLPFVVACNGDNGEGSGEGEGEGTGGETGGGNKPGGNKPGDGTGEDAWWDQIDYDPTTLRFKMTKNTNNEELPSGCERYMEGKGGSNTTIDQMVADRNEDALYYTNIEEVLYTYYPDEDDYNFAHTFDKMYDEIYNPDLDSPDMYCNWMTDMLVASLKGCFANVYSQERGANYIKLDDPGYMSELMGSLTLNQEKIYVIASDYFIDLIRSFFCVPVSVDLFNKVVNEDLCEDYDGNGHNIDDFFNQVLEGKWTYAKMMEYCAAVYRDTNADVADEDLKDTLGFALGYNGLPAAGLVYTSSVTVISKEKDENGTGFVYGYADENQDLYSLAAAIQQLVDAKGVMCVTASDAAGVGVTDTGPELLSIRQQFTAGKMLFGGIILVGSLEYGAYQDMKEDEGGGFGVVPVPVYKAGDKYLTQIHVVGRAGGISFYTQKFSECTAFLHYQSSNSTDILNRYYDVNLTYDVADDLEGNVEMLKYLRSNVRTSFDKLFEDAIGFLYENQGDELTSANRWHAIICKAYYRKADIRTEYRSLVGMKNIRLQELVTQYVSLQD